MNPEATSQPSTPEPAPGAGVPAAPADVPVTVTPKAVDMVNTTRESEKLAPEAATAAVRGGGCSGFEYALDFEDEIRDTDLVYDQHGLKVVIDPVSARYLQGTEIDYVFGMQGAGFKFNNPNAVGTCGCGSSFAI